jgi:predicted PurR-regulated permease PerM
LAAFISQFGRSNKVSELAKAGIATYLLFPMVAALLRDREICGALSILILHAVAAAVIGILGYLSNSHNPNVKQA